MTEQKFKNKQNKTETDPYIQRTNQCLPESRRMGDGQNR